jgi:hypothetical protein
MWCHVAELVVPDVSKTVDTVFKQWGPLSQWHSITGQIAWLLSINVATVLARWPLSQNSYWSILWTAAWCDGTQDIKNVYKQWSGNMKGAEHLEDVNMRIILEWILKKHGVNRIWPRIRSSVGLLWISNEHLNATESKEFLDWLSDLSFPRRIVWVRQTGWAFPAFWFTNYLHQTTSAHRCSEVIELRGLYFYYI